MWGTTLIDASAVAVVPDADHVKVTGERHGPGPRAKRSGAGVHQLLVPPLAAT
jgi:hypothetical protein